MYICQKQTILELNNTLGPWLGKTSKMMGGLINDTLVENGIDLTREQWVVLVKLHQKDGLMQNELASITERDKTSLTRLINTMERKNMVKRKKTKIDKRINQVFLTEKGKSSFKKALPVMQSTINALQKGLSDKEIQATINTIKKIQKNLSHLSSNCG